MQVPSVLNDCSESFESADEKQQKACTQFFPDTGVMALLCCHDRMLWTINMTSAGEKQHYVLSLIQWLFKHLPHDITIDILYDIGCQLHRSCAKWGFLQEYLPCLSFAISVFHAFGHQWPCQLVYYPRKCIGFGLTDGEGCKRFWSSLKTLIPSLHVSGISAFFLWLMCLVVHCIYLSIISTFSHLMCKSNTLMRNSFFHSAIGSTVVGFTPSTRNVLL